MSNLTPTEAREELTRLCIFMEEELRTNGGALADYARSYIAACQRMLRGPRYTRDEAIAAQVNYILANLSGWRGEQARATKRKLKLIERALR